MTRTFDFCQWALSLTGLLAMEQAAAAQVGGDRSILFKQHGVDIADKFGGSAAFVGDINGDGLADWIVGSENFDANGEKNAGAARVYSGADSSLIFEFLGTQRTEWLGYGVASAGDVNADGIPDIFVSAFGDLRLDVYSGADSSLIHRFYYTVDEFPYALSALSDLNADGHDDFVLGSRDAPGLAGFRGGTVRVLSGADGSILLTIQGSIVNGKLGTKVVPFPDLDGDTLPDLLVSSAIEPFGSNTRAGAVRVFSSATGDILSEYINTTSAIGTGISLAVIEDFDRDGIADYVSASNGDGVNTPESAGYAVVVSGLTGVILADISGTQESQMLGSAACNTSDLTGDGIADFALSSPLGEIDNTYWQGGFIDLYCGRTARHVQRIGGQSNFSKLGMALDGGMDVDGDGIPEILAGAPKDFIEADEGTAYVYSYRSLIEIDEIELSVAQGGTATVDLLFPTRDAEKGYALLASMRGFGVTRVNGIDVPLKRDKLFDLMLAGNAPSEFSNVYGQLDSAGQARATVTIPPAASSALVGRRLHLAAISFSNQRVRRSSGAVHIDFVP